METASGWEGVNPSLTSVRLWVKPHAPGFVICKSEDIGLAPKSPVTVLT